MQDDAMFYNSRRLMERVDSAIAQLGIGEADPGLPDGSTVSIVPDGLIVDVMLQVTCTSGHTIAAPASKVLQALEGVDKVLSWDSLVQAILNASVPLSHQ
jgi:hypothetical protein